MEFIQGSIFTDFKLGHLKIFKGKEIECGSAAVIQL